MKSKTNWRKLRSLSESEVIARANSDPDAPLLTEKELKGFKRVNPTGEIDVKAVRTRLGLSQEEFAHYFGVSVRTLQEWEQHRRRPTATARNFLQVILRAPKLVQKILST